MNPWIIIGWVLLFAIVAGGLWGIGYLTFSGIEEWLLRRRFERGACGHCGRTSPEPEWIWNRRWLVHESCADDFLGKHQVSMGKTLGLMLDKRGGNLGSKDERRFP